MKSQCHQTLVACCYRGLLLVVLSLCLTPLGAFAQAVSTGLLSGRVSDSETKVALDGARITVAGTSLETFTNQGGEYQLPNVPAGEVLVTASYVGYSNRTIALKVAAGEIAKGNIELVASGVPAGSAGTATARALNDMRAAKALTSVVASDASASMADRNSAESLQRVSGVDIARDKGEGRFAIIRGLDPIYIGVSMNGVRMSSAEKASREAALDVMPPNLTSSLEVNKVQTPDLETDANGSTNIITHTGLEHEGIFAQASAGARWASATDKKGGYTSSMNYSQNGLLGGKLAIAFGVAVDERNYAMPAEPIVGVGWALTKSPTDGLPHWFLSGGQDIRDYDGTRWRQGGSASIDYKFNDTNRVWLRWMDAAYLEHNSMFLTEFLYGNGTVTALTDSSATMTLPKSSILKEEQQIVNNKRLSSLVGGYEGRFGMFTDTLTLAYTTGKYTRPTVVAAFANTGTTGLSYSFVNPYNNVITQNSGPSLFDPASYAFSTKSLYSDTTANMHELTVRDDLRYDFTPGGRPAYLKFGLESREKHNNLDTTKYNITSMPWTLNNGTIFPGTDPRFDTGGFPNFRIRPEVVQSLYLNQGSYGITLNPATTYGGAFMALEEVSSAYLMGGITLGKLDILGGARLEHTHFWMDGWQYDSTTGLASPVITTNNYDKVLPSVVLTYKFKPETIARASWSNTLARPDYSVTAPGRAINDTAKTVSQGNPNIPPLSASNMDVSLEHYFQPLGTVSAGFFYKSLKHFAYSSVAGVDASTGYQLTTYLPGPSAWIYGFEFYWTERLGFLPGPLSGLGVNFSAIDGQSQASYPTRPGEKIPFTGFAKEQMNVGLTYDYKRFHGRVAWHFHAKRLESGSSLGADSTQDQYEAAHRTVDASINYKVTRNWQVYLNGSNLNKEPLKEYYGGTGSLVRIQTFEAYGLTLEGGVKWSY